MTVWIQFKVNYELLVFDTCSYPPMIEIKCVNLSFIIMKYCFCSNLSSENYLEKLRATKKHCFSGSKLVFLWFFVRGCYKSWYVPNCQNASNHVAKNFSIICISYYICSHFVLTKNTLIWSSFSLLWTIYTF